MSSGKTLSNGTLGLRFMQNALRAKQHAAVDLERAKVKDEAEWEVSKEVREALGLGSNSSGKTKQTIAQETSYWPFLFPSFQTSGTPSNAEDAAEPFTSAKLSGRRTFAKGGEIVSPSTSVDGPAGADVKAEEDVIVSSEPSMEQSKSRFTRSGGPRSKARTKKILDRAARLPTEPSSVSEVPVLSMISGETSAAVGMDIRQIRKLKGKEPAPVKTEVEVKSSTSAPDSGNTVTSRKGPLSFLRPAGVDAPRASSVKGKKSKKRERDEEGSGASPSPTTKKTDSESTSSAYSSERQSQTARKKKKLESGLSAESS